MGFHVQESAYDENFDLAFVQRFWAGEGLAAGESASANGMVFVLGTGPFHITFRFTYLTSNSPSAGLHTDSVPVVCQ